MEPNGPESPLGLIARWPARHATAGVTRAGETVVTSGPAAQPFALASVTKLITAYAVLVATEEGTVGLDDEAGPPGSTVRHLLAHASGLGPDGRPLADPGTRRIYSNAGFGALGDHLAAAAGMPFATYAREAVIEPLRLGATRMEGSPAYGAWSSVDDLLRFCRELLDPALIGPSTLAAATRPAFPGLAGVLPGFGRHDPNDWGLGFEIRGGKSPHWSGHRNSPRTFGHFGRSGAFLWVDPAARLACVALTDLDFGPWAVEAWPALSDAVLEAWGGTS
jgi:CubicO group peptidase (beta-lactamase class C family)